MTADRRRSDASRRRLVHVISTPEGVGGAERVLATLVAAGDEAGWDVTVLNPFARDRAGTELRELVGPQRYRAYAASAPRHVPAVRRWVQREIAATEPAIVHSHLFHAAVVVASLPRRRVRHTVLSSHHGDHFVQTRARVREQADRLATRRHELVICCSQSVVEHVVHRYGVPKHKVAMIYNGWDGVPLPRVDTDEPTLVCVARLRAHKGHATLLRAFAGVLDEVPDARLMLAGDGPLRDELQALAGQLAIAERVRFLGEVADVWPLLAAADAFVLPSAHEALGIAVLEAMAAGLPVVVSAVGGLRELVSDGHEGRLVAPGDRRALAAALLDVLRSPARALAMGTAGRTKAATFTSVQMAAGYLEQYERLVAQR